LLEWIAEQAESQLKLPRKQVFSQLLERERLGSTGLGQGFAVPHARLEGLDHIHACFLKLDQPIPFDAADQAPADEIRHSHSREDIIEIIRKAEAGG